MILADWQADEGQEGLSGIKVLQSCVCYLDASDIGGEGDGGWGSLFRLSSWVK